ncbi:NAD-dependent epimerase/dehydratase family protein [Actinopolymorpha alba]|uniref:NAD-dependent epimerase/dehydratase family protein n=1 Tax=Actinopolymorpha alba TaxID=533267 RepID=UPI0003786AF8|nr:NAD(P)-dependent oxidoreductase [Actinopolymorpha alba]
MARGRTVLVTGANGMLGSHIVDRLSREGHQVIALDLARGEPGYGHESPADQVTDVVGDVTDARLLGSLVGAADAVVHVAAILPKAGGSPAGPLLAVNVVATHTLFEVAGNKPVVFASSGSVYGVNRTAVGGAAPAPFVETDEALTRDFYGLSKYVNERYAEAFAAANGMRWAALRLGVLFGARLRMGLTSRFLLSVLDDVDAGRVPTVDGDPNAALDWVQVADAAECFVRALDVGLASGLDGGQVNAPINVSTGAATRLEDVLTALLRLYGAPTQIEWTGPSQPNGAISTARYYDPSRARQLLGFAPDPDYTHGLQAFIDWRAAARER